MANLSALLGGGVKSVTRYTIPKASVTENNDWSQSFTITAVADVNKTSLNLLTAQHGKWDGATNFFAGALLGIRLSNTTTVEYISTTNADGGETEIAFEVIEYN